MRVFRGPRKKPFRDESHEYVSTISSEELERSIRSGSYIQFNITKDVNERQSVCTARFENVDIIPMVSGLMSRLKGQQVSLLEIKKIMDEKEISETDKLEKIQSIVENI